MKKKRNLSGVYFKFKNPETSQMEARCFEDLPEEEQEKHLDKMSEQYTRNMVKALADTLNEIGEASGSIT